MVVEERDRMESVFGRVTGLSAFPGKKKKRTSEGL